MQELQNGECSVVDQTANQIVIRLCDQVTFDPGQAIVKDQFKPLAAKIAACWTRSRAGFGWSDIPTTHRSKPCASLPIGISPSSAPKAVAALIKQGLTDPNRVDVDGKGPDVPIASNATPEGRAKNRRVEVMIGRTSE